MKKLILLLLFAATARAQTPAVMLAAVPQAHSVAITCTQSPSPGVTGNFFYRSTTSGGPYTKLNAAATTTCTYTDATVAAGTTYYYVATAYRASDSAESPYSNQVSAAVPGGVVVLMISTSALPQATVGTPYTATLAATGGTAPYVWTVTGLPAGITASGAAISGTPTAAGTSSVGVTVRDSATPVASATSTLPLVVAAQQPSPYTMRVSSPALPVSFTADGCKPVVIDDDTPSGPLPLALASNRPWLTVTPATGQTPLTAQVCVAGAGLTGTVTGAVTVTATGPNAAGYTVNNSPMPVPVSFAVPVAQQVAVTVAPTSVALQVGQSQQFAATVTGTSNTAVTWSANALNGLFTATAAGTSTVTVTSVADATKSASATVNVAAPQGKFAIGDAFVVATSGARLNVRSGPSPTASIVTTLVNGATGTITGGPTASGANVYWQIATGWLLETYIQKPTLTMSCAWVNVNATYRCDISGVAAGASVHVAATSGGQSAASDSVRP